MPVISWAMSPKSVSPLWGPLLGLHVILSPSWMKYLPPWAQCELSPVVPLQLDFRSRGLLNDYDYFHWKDLNEILGGSKYQPH